MACFDAFCQTITQKTCVVLDNASIHTSEAFEHVFLLEEARIDPEISPPVFTELNLIEILWRHIKYRWLPFSLTVSQRVN